jgi:hypothetical protein
LTPVPLTDVLLLKLKTTSKKEKKNENHSKMQKLGELKLSNFFNYPPSCKSQFCLKTPEID